MYAYRCCLRHSIIVAVATTDNRGCAGLQVEAHDTSSLATVGRSHGDQHTEPVNISSTRVNNQATLCLLWLDVVWLFLCTRQR